MAEFRFSDFNSNFRQNSSPVVYDASAIMLAVYHLFHTKKGERLFEEEIEADIGSMLFELISDDDLSNIIKIRALAKKLEFHEPRIRIVADKSDFSVDRANHTVKIRLGIAIAGDISGNVKYFEDIIKYD